LVKKKKWERRKIGKEDSEKEREKRKEIGVRRPNSFEIRKKEEKTAR